MAKRFSDTGYLIKETIKGLPEATDKVGKAIGKAAKKAGEKIRYELAGGKYGERMNKKSQERMEKWTKEMERANQWKTSPPLSDFLGTTKKLGKITKFKKKEASNG